MKLEVGGGIGWGGGVSFRLQSIVIIHDIMYCDTDHIMNVAASG